jgi:hypothetical protein
MRPNRTICSTIPLTLSIGMAKPTPLNAPEGLAMAVLMPISRPLESNRGPPLLPGLMAASVWITPAIGRPVAADSISRPTPLTIPVVSVWSSPNGFPIANTFCPTRNALDRPSGTGRSRRPPPGRTSNTATSLSSSNPSTFAGYSVGSPRNVAVTSDASRTTWKFVTTIERCASVSHTKPEPAPRGTSVASRL